VEKKQGVVEGVKKRKKQKNEGQKAAKHADEKNAEPIVVNFSIYNENLILIHYI
jgi:hypothetical protein